MTMDGELKPALDIFDWLQQHFIEQCALVVELIKEGIALPQNLPCQLAYADGGYVAPRWMECAGWWSDASLYAELVRERRRAFSEVAAARIVLEKIHPCGHQIFELLKPKLGPAPLSEFPCEKARLGEFMEGLNPDNSHFIEGWRLRAGDQGACAPSTTKCKLPRCSSSTTGRTLMCIFTLSPTRRCSSQRILPTSHPSSKISRHIKVQLHHGSKRNRVPQGRVNFVRMRAYTASQPLSSTRSAHHRRPPAVRSTHSAHHGLME